MNLLQIKYFVEVASQHSLAKAAKSLYVSPSTLSVSISNLEKALQTKLFFRDNTGMYLTDAGNLIFDDAKTIIQLIDSWPHRLHPEIDEISGKIHIVSRPMITESLLIDAIHIAKERYPQLELIIEDELFSVQSLLDKNTNLAFAIFHENDSNYSLAHEKAKNAGYTAELLYRMTLRVFLHPDNPLAVADTIALDDLKNYFFVGLYNANEDDMFCHFLSAFPSAQIISMPNRNAIMRYIKNNPMAFSLLLSSEEMNDQYDETDGICQISLESDFYSQDIYLFYPDEKNITPAEKCTVEIIKELI